MNQIRTILVSGSVPTVNQLALGDIAINTVDGKAFLKKYSGSVETVIEIGAGITPISASYAITASYAQTATTASYFSGSISNAISASYAATASTAETAQNILVYCKNQSGYTIDKGMVVRITGSNNSSDIPRIISASYENDNNSANTLGIANESISNGNEGFVMTEGVLKGIDTNAYISGQLLYLGPTGSITGSAPRAPLHAVRLGEVIRHQSINGSIYVRIDNGYELGELHDVLDNTTTGSYGDLLIKSGSVWTNSRSLTGSYELTGSLSISGSIVAPSFTGSFTGSFSGSFTGSLFGTASNALTASYLNPLAQTVRLTGSLVITGSVIISSSATFINIGPAVFTGSAGTGSAVTVYKSGSTAFDIQGSSGQLFAVTDSLTGSLFSVNTAAGLPVIEAFSDNTVNIGKFGTYPIKVAATGTLAIITGSFTGSFTGSATTAVTASYALTSSFVNTLNQNVTITGDVSVLGTASINNLVVNQIGYSSGSNQLGDAASDTQTLYGAVRIPTGSLQISGALQISSSQPSYIVGSGFVGIGTTGPGYNLDVSGSIRATSYVYANDALVTDSIVSVGNADLALNKTTAYSLLLSTTGRERMRVNAAGNVGIGTTVPQRRLHVDSSGSATTAEPLILTSIDTNNRVGITFASSSLASGRQHRLFHRTTTPTVEWILNTNAGENAVWYLLPRDDTSYSFSISNPYNGGTVYASTGINQPMLSLGAGGISNQYINISASGNVGINTTTATARFQVKGSGTTSATTAFRVENANLTASLTITDNGRVSINDTAFSTVGQKLEVLGNVAGPIAGFGARSTSAPMSYTISGDNNWNIIGSNMYFSASAYYHVFIDRYGVFHKYSPQGGTTSAAYSIELIPTTGSAGPITSSVAFQVLNNGNIGIGTTAPAHKLDISGSGRFTNGLTVTGSTIAKGDFTVTGATTTDINTSTLNINAPLFTVPSFATPYSPSATVRVVMYDAVSNALFVTASTAASPVIVNTIATGSITASVQIGPAATVPYFFLVQSGSVEMLKINAERVMVLEARTTVPTAVTGGIYYSASGDFYFGM